jgi:hypothetical protein
MAIITPEFNGLTHSHNPKECKYRIGISLTQYRILAALVQAEKNSGIHPTDYDIELSLLYMQLVRMIKNIAGDLKKPDSAYVAPEFRKRLDHFEVTAESLGLSDEARLLEMSEPEAEEYWKKEQEKLMGTSSVPEPQ